MLPQKRSCSHRQLPLLKPSLILDLLTQSCQKNNQSLENSQNVVVTCGPLSLRRESDCKTLFNPFDLIFLQLFTSVVSRELIHLIHSYTPFHELVLILIPCSVFHDFSCLYVSDRTFRGHSESFASRTR